MKTNEKSMRSAQKYNCLKKTKKTATITAK